MRRAVPALAVWLAGCSGAFAQVQLANPASQNCIDKGGALHIELKANGQYGVCSFGADRQCEEWAMFHGDCPTGGVPVAAYRTAAARYCATTGGRYDEAGTSCILAGGKTCGADDYYTGTCSRE